MLNFIFILPTFLLFFSSLPQMLKLIKTKKSNDLSIITYFLTGIAVFLLTIKSYLINDFYLCFANSVSFSMLSINLFLIFKYK